MEERKTGRGGARANSGGYRPGAGRKPSPATPPKLAAPEKPKSDPILAEILEPEGCEATSIAFLEAVVKNNEVDLRLRIEAAKQLLPYQAKRMGEAGKKEEAAQKSKTSQKGTDWEGLLQ